MADLLFALFGVVAVGVTLISLFVGLILATTWALAKSE